jgi:hypothetical protein
VFTVTISASVSALSMWVQAFADNGDWIKGSWLPGARGGPATFSPVWGGVASNGTTFSGLTGAGSMTWGATTAHWAIILVHTECDF